MRSGEGSVLVKQVRVLYLALRMAEENDDTSRSSLRTAPSSHSRPYTRLPLPRHPLLRLPPSPRHLFRIPSSSHLSLSPLFFSPCGLSSPCRILPFLPPFIIRRLCRFRFSIPVLSSPFRSPARRIRGHRRRFSILFFDASDSLPRPPGFALVVSLEDLPVVFVSGPEIIFEVVKVGVEAGGLGEEVTVALGVLF